MRIRDWSSDVCSSDLGRPWEVPFVLSKAYLILRNPAGRQPVGNVLPQKTLRAPACSNAGARGRTLRRWRPKENLVLFLVDKLVGRDPRHHAAQLGADLFDGVLRRAPAHGLEGRDRKSTRLNSRH